MTVMVSYQEWTTRYMDELHQAGATREDAAVAVLLGWDILRTHQACYGVESTTPVHFSAIPSTITTNHIAHVAACCSGPRFGGDEFYVVYVPGQAKYVADWQHFTSGRVSAGIFLEGIAVHEVRHRVQNRETATLRMFERDKLAGQWPDEHTAVVAMNMHEQFFEDERHDRAAGMSPEDLAWLYSEEEYDAAVVERLFIHRHDTVVTDDQLASFVRMNCPRMPSRRS